MSERLIVDAAAFERFLTVAAGRSDPTLNTALAQLLRKGTSPAPPPRPWIPVKEAAYLYRVHERTVRRAVSRGEWPHLRVGRRLLVAASGPQRTRADTPVAGGTAPAEDDDNAKGTP